MHNKSKHQRTRSKQKSERQSNQEKMLKKALQQPGMREVMKIYEHWQSANRGLDPYYRMAGNSSTTTTNHT